MGEYSGKEISTQEAIAILKARYPDAPETVMSINTDPPRAVLGLPIQHDSIVVHQIDENNDKTWLLEIEGRPRSQDPGNLVDDFFFPFNAGGHKLKAMMREEPAVSEDTKVLAQGHVAEMLPEVIIAMRATNAINAKHVDYKLTDSNCNSAAGEIARTVVGNENIPDMDGWEPGIDDKILTDDERNQIRDKVYSQTYIDDETLAEQFNQRFEEEKAKVFTQDSEFSRMSYQELLEHPPILIPGEQEPAIDEMISINNDELEKSRSDYKKIEYEKGVDGTAYTTKVLGLTKGNPEVNKKNYSVTIDGKSANEVFGETANPDPDNVRHLNAKELEQPPIIEGREYKHDISTDNGLHY